jgi:propane monooxygenase reductase subunit
VDIKVPGTDGSRSFSMANTSSGDGRLEFVIKVYPDGCSPRSSTRSSRSATGWT